MPKKIQKKLIKKYAAVWHSAANKGAIKTWFSPTGVHTWKYDNPAEFAAVLMILQGDDDPYATSAGHIATGPQIPGMY